MINAKGTRVICTKIPNDSKKRLNGWVYEINGEKPISFNSKLAVKQQPKTNPQASAKRSDLLYRIVLSMRPLTDDHRQDLLRRGLSQEVIDSYAGHPGFGSYFTDKTYGKNHHPHDMQLGFAPSKDGKVAFKSRWDFILKKLGLPTELWKGVPVFYLPLDHMARAYARLGSPAKGDWGEYEAAALRIRNAMAENPDALAGTGRIDTAISQITKGRVIAKIGADAVYCMAVRDEDMGIAFKVEDGSYGAVNPAVMAVLKYMYILTKDEYEQLQAKYPPVLKNHRGDIIGTIEYKL